MPAVSILVPVVRPHYLDAAIGSALSQTMGDFELLVGDDCPSPVVEPLLARWGDTRIRYLPAPRPWRPGGNRDNLIAHAKGHWVKFLFDDDMLMPHSLHLLTAAGTKHDAALAFQGRAYVAADGSALPTLPQLVVSGGAMPLSPQQFFERTMSVAINYVGEPTNVLIRTDILQSSDQFSLGSMRMRFLTDMALYTNVASGGGNMVGVGYFGSVIRQHAAQSGASTGRLWSAGLFEWELLMRWCMQHGYLDFECYARGIAAIHAQYRPQLRRFPELAAFLQLQGLPDPEGNYMGGPYALALAQAWAPLQSAEGHAAGASTSPASTMA